MSEEQREQAESENRQEPGSWVATIGGRQVALKIPHEQASARAMSALVGIIDVLQNPEDSDKDEIEAALKNLNNLLELFVAPLFLRAADRRAVDAMLYSGEVGTGDVVMLVAQGPGNREQRREAARVAQKPKRHGGGGRGGKRNH
jgi:hypothetical protein